LGQDHESLDLVLHFFVEDGVVHDWVIPGQLEAEGQNMGVLVGVEPAEMLKRGVCACVEVFQP